jgi:hydroxyacylglutathione hydrolase
MEIISGIHQINGMRGVNCYLALAETRLLLIDTGMPGNGERILKYVERIGKKPSDISYVILTHADMDHVGSAAEIKKLTGARLVIHAGDALILSGKNGPKAIKGPFGVLFNLIGRFMRFQPVEPDLVLKENIDIDGFKIIHTPGHTHGSICVYQPGKAIFVGDALRSDSNGNPKRPSKNLSLDIVQARASLNEIAKLEFEVLLPGHGAPVVGHASAKLKKLLEQW